MYIISSVCYFNDRIMKNDMDFVFAYLANLVSAEEKTFEKERSRSSGDVIHCQIVYLRETRVGHVVAYEYKYILMCKLLALVNPRENILQNPLKFSYIYYHLWSFFVCLYCIKICICFCIGRFWNEIICRLINYLQQKKNIYTLEV